MDPLAEVLDYVQVVQKEQSISENRAKQNEDAAKRHANRIRIKGEIDELETALKAPCSSFSFALFLQNLDSKRRELQHCFFLDDFSDSYWCDFFSRPENILTHNERKLLRSFDNSTAVAERFSRTPTPVVMSRALYEAKQSPSKSTPLPFLPQRILRASSSIVLGNGQTIPLTLEQHSPLQKRSSFFYTPTNGSAGAVHASQFSPARNIPAAQRKSSDVISSSVKDKNRESLQLLLRKHFREAEKILLQVLETIPSSESDDNSKLERSLTLCNLSIIKRQSNQLREAEVLLSEAMEIESSLYGTPAVSTLLNMSALLFTKDPNSDEALRLVRASIEQLNAEPNSPLLQVSHAHLEHIQSVRKPA